MGLVHFMLGMLHARAVGAPADRTYVRVCFRTVAALGAGAEDWLQLMPAQGATMSSQAADRIAWAQDVLDVLVQVGRDKIVSRTQCEQIYCVQARIAALSGRGDEAYKLAIFCRENEGCEIRLRTFVPALVAYCMSSAPFLMVAAN
jgi:hypothetical protein